MPQLPTITTRLLSTAWALRCVKYGSNEDIETCLVGSISVAVGLLLFLLLFYSSSLWLWSCSNNRATPTSSRRVTASLLTRTLGTSMGHPTAPHRQAFAHRTFPLLIVGRNVAILLLFEVICGLVLMLTPRSPMSRN